MATWVGEGGMQGTSPLSPGLPEGARAHYDALQAKIDGGMTLKEVVIEAAGEETGRRLLHEGHALARIALREDAIDRARARKAAQ